MFLFLTRVLQTPFAKKLLGAALLVALDHFTKKPE